VRVLIAGVAGYPHWSLAQHLTARGHDVAAIDNGTAVQPTSVALMHPVNVGSILRHP
jgi:nucleoside-diphosphate-sugar epimerase